VTLSLTGPEQKGGSPPPNRFDYQITEGTGSFGSASGSGTVTLTLAQSPRGGSSPPGGLKSQKGEFTLTFGPVGAGGNSVALYPLHFPWPTKRDGS
jgi:hypothetical protein